MLRHVAQRLFIDRRFETQRARIHRNIKNRRIRRAIG